MATVVFSSAQRALTGGAERVEVEARRVQELIQQLVERYPNLRAELDGAAVAIDGEIHNDARYLSLSPTAEVHFVGRVAGG